MLRDRPVARLSAALEGTNPNTCAAVATFSRVLVETEPRPDNALDAVDFETRASFATSESVVKLFSFVQVAFSWRCAEPTASCRLDQDFLLPSHLGPLICRKVFSSQASASDFHIQSLCPGLRGLIE